MKRIQQVLKQIGCKSITFAAMLAMGATTVAQAAPIAYAEGALQTLSYRLIDLDPSDGITPWARFNVHDNYFPSSGAIQLEYSYQSALSEGLPFQLEVSGLPFFGGTTELASPRAIAAKTDAGLRSEVYLDGSDLDESTLLNWVSQTPASSTLRLLDYSATAALRGPLMFEISAKTALILEGEATGQYGADFSALEASALGQLAQSQGRQLTIDSRNQITALMQSYPYAPGEFVPMPGDRIDVLQASESQPFSLRMDNASSNDLTGGIYLSAQSSVSLGITPVPEPGTLMLTTLGLLGLAIGARRGRCLES